MAQSIWTDTVPPIGPPSLIVVEIDDLNRVWLGHIGLAVLDGGSWSTFYPDSGYPTRDVRAISVVADTAWIGTANGLVKKTAAGWQVFNTTNSGIPDDSVTALLAYDGKLYVGLKAGMAVLEGTNWTYYDSTNSTLSGRPVKSIAANRFGVYVANANSICMLSAQGAWLKLLEYATVNKLTADRDDRIWFNESGTNHQCKYFHDQSLREPDSAFFTGTCPSASFIAPERSSLVGIHPNGKAILYTELPEQRPSIRTILPTDRVDSIYTLNDVFRRSIFYSASSSLYTKKVDFNQSGRFVIYSNLGVIHSTDFDSMQSSTPGAFEPDECPWIDKNNALGRISNAGLNFFYQTADFGSSYEVPARTGIMAIKLQSFWLGAIDDATDTMHFAGRRYGFSGTDFWPGPLDTLQATIDSATSQAYDRIWKVERSDIEEFYTNFLLGNVANGSYTIPASIADWPAHGTGNYSRSLAPFHDTNQDGAYNPYDGDYPEIKGDQMLWWVMNDNLGPHTESGALHNLGFELQCSAYAFNCPQPAADDSAINYTTFYSCKIINRSPNSYSDFSLGLFTMWHLGFYEDNYIGCDSANAFTFVYNADDYDGDSYPREPERVYGHHPPMVSLVPLRGLPAMPADGEDNDRDGVIDEPGEYHLLSGHTLLEQDGSSIGMPSRAKDMFLFLNSRWKDSSRIVYGGIGYDPGSTNYTRYMYSGEPFSGTGWTELTNINNQPNLPYRRQSLSISGPSHIGPGESVQFDYAYVFSRVPDQPNGLHTSVARNRFDVLRVKHWFERDSFPCSNGVIGISETADESLFDVFPSPATDLVRVQLHGSLQQADLCLINAMGQEVMCIRCPGPSTVFSVRHLPSGLYAVRLREGNSNARTRWLVVQH